MKTVTYTCRMCGKITSTSNAQIADIKICPPCRMREISLRFAPELKDLQKPKDKAEQVLASVQRETEQKSKRETGVEGYEQTI